MVFRQWPLFRVAEAVESMHKFDSAPWNWQVKRRGFGFASNRRVADFFQEVYGWTASTWLSAQGMRGGDGARSLAGIAFGRFCAIPTSHDEPGTEPNSVE